MKKFFGIALVVVIAAGIGAYVFREPLQQALIDRVTQDMFVARDNDRYDPGTAVGVQLPALRARYQNHEVAQLDEFAGANGTVLYVNRSVDW